MKNIFRGIILTGLFSLLAACGDPKLDTSSKSAMEASASEIQKNMSADERVAFQRDLQTIASSYINVQSLNIAKIQEGEIRMAADLHNKSAKDIKKMAEKIRN